MPELRHYYIDESGSGDLFNRRGKILLGTSGITNYFMLGLVYLPDPLQLEQEFRNLRSSILSDSYLNQIPSIQQAANKTAIKFHAKDDVPEVRREVFKIIRVFDIHFSAVIKDMRSVLRYVQARNNSETQYKYHPNELYDYAVRRLFRDKLHKHDTYKMIFSNRGMNTGRTRALKSQLEFTRDRFLEKIGHASTAKVEVVAAQSEEHAGLQAVDYCLWALQRMYEREEDRYVNYIADKISVIIDVDDIHTAQYGAYYTKRNPPTLQDIRNRKV
ncbi:MAG: DUF3800 domain-containing protein [bacterium]